MPPKPIPPKPLRAIADRDPCDCVMPEVEEIEALEEEMMEEQQVIRKHYQKNIWVKNLEKKSS